MGTFSAMTLLVQLGWVTGRAPVCNKISRISDPRRLFTGRRMEDPA